MKKFIGGVVIISTIMIGGYILFSAKKHLPIMQHAVMQPSANTHATMLMHDIEIQKNLEPYHLVMQAQEGCVEKASPIVQGTTVRCYVNHKNTNVATMQAGSAILNHKEKSLQLEDGVTTEFFKPGK